MKFDVTLPATPLQQVPLIAQAAETLGAHGLWITETQHDPFLPGPLIAEHTRSIQFGTGIAVSFARSPATLAYTAWDLAQASHGRFILGLGTQVQAHITRRFGMPWPDSPVGKLREQLQAIRAFWNTWQTGAALNHRGEHYKLTLMSPFFNPGPIDHPDIPIYIAGVNTGLAHLAGESADGFLVHPFHTRQYLAEVLHPAIAQGASQAGRKVQDCAVSATAFVVTAPEEADFARQQIAFYASTPSYRRVMDLHGWGETAEALTGLAPRGRWSEMFPLITDEMLELFAVIAAPADLGLALQQRYAGLVDRLGIYFPFVPGQRDDLWRGLVAAFA